LPQRLRPRFDGKVIIVGLRSVFLFGAEQSDLLRTRNFHPPEDLFAWSEGRWSEIEFPLDLPQAGPPAHVWVSIELDVFRRPPLLAGQDVFIYLNGWRAASLHITERQVVHVRVRGSLLEAEGNLLTFDLPDATRPADFGEDDQRLLGVQIFSLQFEAAEAPDHAQGPLPAYLVPALSAA
jgi:hypothetical protein